MVEEDTVEIIALTDLVECVVEVALVVVVEDEIETTVDEV